MIKYQVHIVKVTRSNEKIQFQIRLPRNAKRIVALKVTAQPLIKLVHKIAPDYAVEAGWLWLRIPEKRDVFFADTVKRPLPLHSKTVFNHKTIGDFDGGSYWTQGTKEEFLSIEADLTTNVLEGFYIDRIHTEQTMIDPHEKQEQQEKQRMVEQQEKQKKEQKEKRPKQEKDVPQRPEPNKPSPGDRIGYEVRIYLKLEV